MVTRAHTVAFLGVEAKPVEVQCALTPGLHAFNVVGLPDKAVSESRERVRAALTAIGLAMPPPARWSHSPLTHRAQNGRRTQPESSNSGVSHRTAG